MIDLYCSHFFYIFTEEVTKSETNPALPSQLIEAGLWILVLSAVDIKPANYMISDKDPTSPVQIFDHNSPLKYEPEFKIKDLNDLKSKLFSIQLEFVDIFNIPDDSFREAFIQMQNRVKRLKKIPIPIHTVPPRVVQSQNSFESVSSFPEFILDVISQFEQFFQQDVSLFGGVYTRKLFEIYGYYERAFGSCLFPDEIFFFKAIESLTKYGQLTIARYGEIERFIKKYLEKYGFDFDKTQVKGGK